MKSVFRNNTTPVKIPDADIFQGCNKLWWLTYDTSFGIIHFYLAKNQGNKICDTISKYCIIHVLLTEAFKLYPKQLHV